MIILKIGWEDVLKNSKSKNYQFGYDPRVSQLSKDYNRDLEKRIKELNKLIISGAAVVE